MQLNERDMLVMREINRWRFMLGRHIAILCGFSSFRTADRRLKMLIEAGYLERKKMLYGTPGIYTLTHQGRMMAGASKKADKIRVDKLKHDILVMDALIHIIQVYKISLNDVVSEKEMHQKDGYGNRKHRPDFVFTKDEKTYAVEVELTLKKKERMEENLKSNFRNYDKQLWVISKDSKIERILNEHRYTYPNTIILHLETIKDGSDLCWWQ